MAKTNPKSAKCEKCGSEDVAWFKSKRTGKFYLCEVFTDEEGDRISSHRDFHSKYCGVDGAHEAEQAKRTIDDNLGLNDKKWHDDYADQVAFDIANLNSVTDRVLAIADLARSNPSVSLKVRNLWRKQGENLLADMLDGIINAH